MSPCIHCGQPFKNGKAARVHERSCIKTKTFRLMVACNADDRHWDDASCYREVATCEVPSTGMLEDWKRAAACFSALYPRVMQLFGVDARVAITRRSEQAPEFHA